MKHSLSKLPGSRASFLPALTAALMSAGLLTETARAQIQTAGTVFVNVDATQLAEGTLTNIANAGTLAGSFKATGDETTFPVVATEGGTKGIRFDGTDFLQLVDASSVLVLPPAGLVGEDATCSIEVWALNPQVSGEETMVSWGKRGGP